MKGKNSKINRIRSYALNMTFLGFVVMYGAIFFKQYQWLVFLFMSLGILLIFASAGTYVWVGVISSRAPVVICPNCNQPTKVLGRVDICIHCKQPLTMDRSLEGREFDAKYNRKSESK